MATGIEMHGRGRQKRGWLDSAGYQGEDRVRGGSARLSGMQGGCLCTPTLNKSGTQMNWVVTSGQQFLFDRFSFTPDRVVTETCLSMAHH